MNSWTTCNLGIYDRILRFGVGMGIVVIVLGWPAAPPWLALLTPALVIPAIIAWDPVHALLGRAKTGKSIPVRMTEKPA